MLPSENGQRGVQVRPRPAATSRPATRSRGAAVELRLRRRRPLDHGHRRRRRRHRIERDADSGTAIGIVAPGGQRTELRHGPAAGWPASSTRPTRRPRSSTGTAACSPSLTDAEAHERHVHLRREGPARPGTRARTERRWSSAHVASTTAAAASCPRTARARDDVRDAAARRRAAPGRPSPARAARRPSRRRGRPAFDDDVSPTAPRSIDGRARPALGRPRVFAGSQVFRRPGKPDGHRVDDPLARAREPRRRARPRDWGEGTRSAAATARKSYDGEQRTLTETHAGGPQTRTTFERRGPCRGGHAPGRGRRRPGAADLRVGFPWPARRDEARGGRAGDLHLRRREPRRHARPTARAARSPTRGTTPTGWPVELRGPDRPRGYRRPQRQPHEGHDAGRAGARARLHVGEPAAPLQPPGQAAGIVRDWDTARRLDKTTLPSAREVDWTYDARGRPDRGERPRRRDRVRVPRATPSAPRRCRGTPRAPRPRRRWSSSFAGDLLTGHGVSAAPRTARTPTTTTRSARSRA